MGENHFAILNFWQNSNQIENDNNTISILLFFYKFICFVRSPFISIWDRREKTRNIYIYGKLCFKMKNSRTLSNTLLRSFNNLRYS